MNVAFKKERVVKAGSAFGVCLLFCFWMPLFAQDFSSSGLNLPFNRQFYLDTERALAKLDASQHTAMKPYRMDELPADAYPDSLKHLKAQNSWLGRTIHREYYIQKVGTDWAIKANPLFDLSLGLESFANQRTYFNGRGAQIFGYIGRKVSFYTSLYENQAVFPNYVDSTIRRYNVVPGQGHVRPFGSKGWNFGNATGYISLTPSRFFNVQIGHDRIFWGEGYRSLLLSDQTYPFPFIKLSTNFGPFKYQYVFMQHSDLQAPPLNFTTGYRQKYMATGFLSWQVNRRFNLSAFQAVVWQADDSIGGRRGIELNYLNPLIFWRPVQYSLGSEGNLLLGFNAKYKLSNQAFLYYQFMLDEFIFGDLLGQNGSAGNKYAWQLGLRWFDVAAVEGLSMQLEYNQARPYTYGHWSTLTSYTHYNQSLAHPLGANFREALVLLDFKRNRLLLHGKLMGARMGLDKPGYVSGQDVFTSFLNRPQEKGIEIGNGERADLVFAELRAGYMVNSLTNAQFHLGVVARNRRVAGANQQSLFFTIGFSTHLRNLYYDY